MEGDVDTAILCVSISFESGARLPRFTPPRTEALSRTYAEDAFKTHD